MSASSAVSGQLLLRALLQCLRAMRLYPEGHPARHVAEDRLLGTWGAVLAQGTGLVLDVARGELLVDGELPERIPTELHSELLAGVRGGGAAALRLPPQADPAALLGFLAGILRGAPARNATGAVPVVRTTTAPVAPPAPEPPPPAMTAPRPVVTAPRPVPVSSSSAGVRIPTTGAGLPVPPANVRQALQNLATCWISIEQGYPDRHAFAEVLRFVAGRPGDGLSRPVPLVGGTTSSHPVLEHALDIARVAALAARASGLSGSALDELVMAALCADIGMRSVPLELIQRPLRFSHEDFRVIRQHPQHGARTLLACQDLPELVGVVAYEHHLRRDGKGYPQVPHSLPPHPGSLLVQAADAYTALRTTRPFRPALGEPEARQLMRKLAATALCPEAVELMLMRAVPAGCARIAS